MHRRKNKIVFYIQKLYNICDHKIILGNLIFTPKYKLLTYYIGKRFSVNGMYSEI